ncbi:MAG: hypothetical protein JNJ90_12390 [Saprospiraceae bacterium]|nr:hypothetical protein [Saprospiraceae bacterium]
MPHTFADFIGKFPPVPMPVILGEDTHHVFALENDPLSEKMIVEFIHPTDPAVLDDAYTEYVPCFSLEGTENFAALVWWKAELMNYEYVLATFTLKGELIARRVIGYTRVQPDGKVARAVATIDEEWVVFIAEGVSADGQAFDPTSSKTWDVEVMTNGEIV